MPEVAIDIGGHNSARAQPHTFAHPALRIPALLNDLISNSDHDTNDNSSRQINHSEYCACTIQLPDILTSAQMGKHPLRRIAARTVLRRNFDMG